jgi:hypothetical protein
MKLARSVLVIALTMIAVGITWEIWQTLPQDTFQIHRVDKPKTIMEVLKHGDAQIPVI